VALRPGLGKNPSRSRVIVLEKKDVESTAFLYKREAHHILRLRSCHYRGSPMLETVMVEAIISGGSGREQK
jgi:hypothetical protein